MQNGYRIIQLRQEHAYTQRATDWFSSKWRVPREAYEESIAACQANTSGIPQWYIVLNDKDEIIAGLGAIENDFHKRKDLALNICAVYVEKEYRLKGIAKLMLDYACSDLAGFGIHDAYLITDHTEFYEKCDWEFFGMIEENSGELARMYHKHTKNTE